MRDSYGIHHVTFESIIECPPELTACVLRADLQRNVTNELCPTVCVGMGLWSCMALALRFVGLVSFRLGHFCMSAWLARCVRRLAGAVVCVE